MSRLRKALGEGASAILTREVGYELSVDPASIDACRFEQAVGEAKRAPDPEALLEDALALWRGAPLSDFVYEPFAQAEAARLKELRVATIEDRIEADLRAGQAAELVSELQALSGRNAKDRWVDDWEREPDAATRAATALRSAHLREAADAYEEAFRADLNHVYSGLNPLATVSVRSWRCSSVAGSASRITTCAIRPTRTKPCRMPSSRSSSTSKRTVTRGRSMCGSCGFS